jgi:hypothetical protein
MQMTFLAWTLITAAAGTLGAIAAVGVYTEAHRAPDQP